MVFQELRSAISNGINRGVVKHGGPQKTTQGGRTKEKVALLSLYISTFVLSKL